MLTLGEALASLHGIHKKRTRVSNMFSHIAEIMYFVPDRRAATEWYSSLFRIEITVLDNPEHFFIQVGSQEI